MFVFLPSLLLLVTGKSQTTTVTVEKHSSVPTSPTVSQSDIGVAGINIWQRRFWAWPVEFTLWQQPIRRLSNRTLSWWSFSFFVFSPPFSQLNCELINSAPQCLLDFSWVGCLERQPMTWIFAKGSHILPLQARRDEQVWLKKEKVIFIYFWATSRKTHHLFGHSVFSLPFPLLFCLSPRGLRVFTLQWLKPYLFQGSRNMYIQRESFMK